MKIAIAGTSWLLPAGLDWPDLVAGKSGITKLEGPMAVPLGGLVPGSFPAPRDFPFPYFPRALGLAVEALKGLQLPQRPYGLAFGLANLYSETDYLEHAMVSRDNPGAMRDLVAFSGAIPMDFMAEALANQVGIDPWHQIGPRLRLDSACATGGDALIAAAHWLRSGLVRDVVVLAASSMVNPMGLALFHNLKALNDQPELDGSCPFDRRRRGFVMGEGAAAVWLTTDPQVPAMAYLKDWGQAMAAESFVDLPAKSEPLARVCSEALGELSPRDVAYVCTHGTSTHSGDARESALYAHMWQDHLADTAFSSVKSMTGHCLAASALIEAIVCVKALQHQIAPPTINFRTPDPDCLQDPVPNQARPISGRYALSNAFAFGGHNNSLLFEVAS